MVAEKTTVVDGSNSTLSEGELFWQNPLGASEELQRKYIGFTPNEFKRFMVSSVVEDGYDKSKYNIHRQVTINPYTKEEIVSEYLVEIPKPSKEEITSKIISGEEVSSEYIDFTDKEIGDIILEAKFDGNINAQLASLLKFNVKLLAYLAGKFGPEVLQHFSAELKEAEEISKIRKKCGLSELKISNLK